MRPAFAVLVAAACLAQAAPTRAGPPEHEKFTGDLSPCTQAHSWSACLAADPECAWCSEAFTCAPHKRAGVPACPGNSWCATPEECQANAAKYGSPAFPPAAWDTTCANGGLIDWTGKEGNTRVGAANCKCPDGWTGFGCEVCTKDAVCSAGGVGCDHTVNPRPDMPVRMSCDCTSALCTQSGFGPGLGVVTIEMRKGPSAAEGDLAAIDILKSVNYPGAGATQVNSPYLIKAGLSGCQRRPRDVPCLDLCGPNGCASDLPWKPEETCRVWDCSNHELPAEAMTLCPPDQPWSQHRGLCGIVQQMMVAPFQFVCVIDGTDGPHVNCGFSTLALPHGQIALSCDIGVCAPPPDANDLNGNGTSISWCEANRADCWTVMYVIIFSTPLVIVAVIFGCVMSASRQQGKALRKIALSMSFGSSADASRVRNDSSRAALLNHPERGMSTDQLALPSSSGDALENNTQEAATTAPAAAGALENGVEMQARSRADSSAEAAGGPSQPNGAARDPTTSSTGTAALSIQRLTTANFNPNPTVLSFSDVRYGFRQRGPSCLRALLTKPSSPRRRRPGAGDADVDAEHEHDSSTVPVVQVASADQGASHHHDVATSVSPSGRSGKDSRFRTVLRGVTGYVGSEMMAILGPSGSGKTSFIDILAGRKNQGQVSGVIELNGVPTTSRERRQRLGYVMQDDVLPGTDTVREYLLFHANLRLTGYSVRERCERVEETIVELGLSKSANSQIGDHFKKGLSGGEKRRVSIGVELLAASEILVLDEPTSGLDSASAKSVIEALRTVVELGHGVVMSIHQPSSALFRTFDKVLLLSDHGETLFCGPRAEVVDFMSSRASLAIPANYNPAEYLLDVAASREQSHMLSAAYRVSETHAEQVRVVGELGARATSNPHHTPKDQRRRRTRPPFAVQCKYLMMRFLHKVIRHPMLAVVNFGATVAVALIAGLLYQGVTNDLQGAINRAGLFFFTLTYLMLSALADLGVWQDEKILFMRERASGCYDAGAYALSKFVGEMLPLKLPPLTFMVILLTFLVGLNKEPSAVAIQLTTLIIVSLVSTLMFLSLGMVFRASGVSSFAAVLVTMYSLLMSGFLLQFGGVSGGGSGGAPSNSSSTSSLEASSGSWLQALSVLFFAFETLMVTEMHGLSFMLIVKSPEGNEVTRVGATGDMVMAQLSLNYKNFERDFVALFVYFAVFMVVVILLLKNVVKERR